MNDNPKIERFFRQNAVGQLLIKRILPLQKELRETTIEEIEGWCAEERLPLEKREIFEAAKKLDDLGIARYLVGRRGAKSRLEWRMQLTDLYPTAPNVASEAALAPAVVNPTPDLTGDAMPTAPIPASASAPDTAPNAAATIEHLFRLRPDFSLALRLPTDLSAAEAERLSAFIKTLPF